LDYVTGGFILQLCLTLHSKNGISLPVHYNQLIQGAIYENISKDLASFLHDSGYTSGGRSFKLFTFSRLLGNFYLDRIKKKINFPAGARLVVASTIAEFCTSLMGCMLGDGVIKLGGVPVEVTSINMEKPVVDGNSISVNMLSPVVTYSTFDKPEGGKYTCYFQPGETEFVRLVEENLRKKYRAYYNKEAPLGEFAVRPLNRPWMNITMYKQTVIKGYTCRLKLEGPRELLQMAVDAGLGSKNSQGYGCLGVKQGIGIFVV
jgi:CRISPR-associated endoribonuclease Cas6